MIFAHGKLLPDTELPVLLDRLDGEINETRETKSLAPALVMDALARLGARLQSGEFDALLAQYLPAGQRVEALFSLLSRENLARKLETELGSAPFAPIRHGQSAALRLPLGTLLHIAPGNMPGLPVYSVLEGLLTGNVNLLKLPRADKGLSLAALSLLTETKPALAPFVYAFDLPSSQAEPLKRLAGMADGLVTWGSDAAVLAARALAGPGCKLIEWGHRLSFAYIAGFEQETEELAALAGEIAQSRQRLCSSCQVIFLDTEDPEALHAFCRRFLPDLEAAVARLAPDSPAAGAQASLSGQSALLERIVDGRAGGERVYSGRGCSLIVRPDRELELSPMEGNVFVKALPRNELFSALRRQKAYLQTAALLCPAAERAALTALLAQAGLTRICRAGHMSAAFPGEAHDGEYPLRRYIRIVDVEA